MEITSFDDLLREARAQSEPQRLLFVFAGAELPEGATAQQHAQFDAGEGGELAPLMCVDKSPSELSGFAAFAAEAAQAGPPWVIVFAAAVSGRGGVPPTSRDIEAPLQRMVDAIKAGRLDGMVPFDQRGEPVRFA
jgi:hypothetical protein